MDHRSGHLTLFCLSLFLGSGLVSSKALRNDLGNQLDDVNPTTPTQTTPTTTGGFWCVARQDASDTALKSALSKACVYGLADCSAILPGGSCYVPNTVRNHASYVFNEHYHKSPGPFSCDFRGTATLTSTDPSSGNCKYDGSSPKKPAGSPNSASSAFNSMLLLISSGLLVSLQLANYI